MTRSLIGKVESSIVRIICSDINSQGSGFLVSPEGFVVTNFHVVAKVKLFQGFLSYDYSKGICVEIKGIPYNASLAIDINSDKPFIYDYAILKVDGLSSAPHLEIIDPTDIRRGDKVICLGYPLDFETMIATDGIVSAIVHGPSHLNALFQMRTIVSNALIQFGNSGGPMIHIDTGKVIGINTRGHELQNPLRHDLEAWFRQPASSSFPVLRTLTDYCLQFIQTGFNHAVSIEHVKNDAAYPHK